MNLNDSLSADDESGEDESIARKAYQQPHFNYEAWKRRQLLDWDAPESWNGLGKRDIESAESAQRIIRSVIQEHPSYSSFFYLLSMKGAWTKYDWAGKLYAGNGSTLQSGGYFQAVNFDPMNN
jgi:hypothetical protein